METEDRWYVRFRGHTLGPLTADQVKSSVRRKELGPEDKLASTSNPAWRALRTEADFLRCWEALTRPIPAELAPLPSPKILWQKKRAPVPVAPAPLAAPTQAADSPALRAPTSSPAPPAPTPSAKAAPAAPKPKAKAKPKKTKPVRKAVKPKAKAEAKPVAESPTVTPPEAQSASDTPESPALAEVPAKPQMQPMPAAATLAAESSAVETKPVAATPKLAEETLSLLEALRDWNRKEKENSPQAAPAREPEPARRPFPIPESPAPAAFSHPQLQEPQILPKENSGIEVKLNLVISKQFIFISGIILALAAAAAIYTFSEAKKMRGPVDSRLPDPSSPTIEPSPEDDPIPQLKAPTRPRRD